MSGAIVAGLLAGYGIAVPVGAIGALLVELTSRTSLRVGAAAAMGVATADGCYALIAVTGGLAVARAVEPIATPMRWVAAIVLLLIAAQTALAAIRDRHLAAAHRGGARLTTPARAYFGLLGLTLLNPATIVYFVALVLGRQSVEGTDSAAEIAFGLAAFVASASWQLLLAVGGAAVGRVLSGARGRLTTAMGSSALIAVFAIHALVGTP